DEFCEKVTVVVPFAFGMAVGAGSARVPELTATFDVTITAPTLTLPTQPASSARRLRSPTRCVVMSSRYVLGAVTLNEMECCEFPFRSRRPAGSTSVFTFQMNLLCRIVPSLIGRDAEEPQNPFASFPWLQLEPAALELAAVIAAEAYPAMANRSAAEPNSADR